MITIQTANAISPASALGLAWALKFLSDHGGKARWEADWELSQSGSQDWVARGSLGTFVFDDQAWSEELGEASPPREIGTHKNA